jgi:hypothetical protein
LWVRARSRSADDCASAGPASIGASKMSNASDCMGMVAILGCQVEKAEGPAIILTAGPSSVERRLRT